MFGQLKFSLTYALRNLRRDRQRTAFALFSIAAGVATVVALRMLGLMLTDALTSNAQAFIHGDIVADASSRGPTISILSNSRQAPITGDIQAKIQKWAASLHVDVTFSLTSELTQAAKVQNDNAGPPAFLLARFVDPKVYPYYDEITADEPSGVPLAHLLTGPNQVVIGRRLADQLGVHAGDTVRVGTAKTLQTVTGIVPDSSEGLWGNPFGLLFSFAYIDQAHEPDFGIAAGSADKAFIKVPAGMSLGAVAPRIIWDWPPAKFGRGYRIDKYTDVLARNQIASDLLSRFVLLLSLVALIIGGTGIINTMLVSVNRRATEIAVLKTLGMKARGIALLFMIEAVAWGIVGSLLGLAVGLLLSKFAQQAGEQAFGVILPWKLYSEPLLLGLGLGIAITTVFSLWPTLIAGQVRPGLVLRQNFAMARAGLIPIVLSIGVLVLGLAFLVESILDFRHTTTLPPSLRNVPIGFIGTLLGFLFLGIVIGLMWILVWILGKLPAFRDPNLRIAIRGLTLHRSRTSLSLLALVIGMTALSGTLILARSINELLDTSLSEPLGGNVIMLPLVPFSDVLVHARLDSEKGISGYRDVRIQDADLLAINHDNNYADKIFTTPDDPKNDILMGQLSLIIGSVSHGNPPLGTLMSGRMLSNADDGQYHIVIPYHPELDNIGVKVGSTFTYHIGGEIRDFEVVGIVAPDPREGFIPFSLGEGAVQAPLDVINRTLPFDFIIANVDKASINGTMSAVGAVPGVFVFDISVLDSIINRLLSQMAALPLLVAALSLFAASVLIATTVSLATMERRRQIGILKALGVNRWQALNQLLIENGLVGMIGGLVSVLPTLLIIAVVPVLTQGLVHLPVPVDLVLLMLALSVGITLLATLLTAWSASGERPLAALRYE